MENILIFYYAGTLFSVLLVAFIIYYVILHQKKVNQYNMQLKQLELNKQQALLIAVTDGEEKECKRLAEELQYGIGAKLSGLKLKMIQEVNVVTNYDDLPAPTYTLNYLVCDANNLQNCDLNSKFHIAQ
ncbi:MAG: hypothetical protein ACOYMA_04695 [Bacteroidia bacterium]